MNRRKFLKTVPASVAGVAVVGSISETEAKISSYSFRLLDESEEWIDIPWADHESFPLHRYIVECPFPVGSNAWLAIADRDQAGQVVVSNGKSFSRFAKPTRRVIFPRFVTEKENLHNQAQNAYQAVQQNGFDTAKGPDHQWRVVHVEYHCPDGIEHVMAGLPMSWDPRLCLSLMVKDQIT